MTAVSDGFLRQPKCPCEMKHHKRRKPTDAHSLFAEAEVLRRENAVLRLRLEERNASVETTPLAPTRVPSERSWSTCCSASASV